MASAPLLLVRRLLILMALLTLAALAWWIGAGTAPS